MRAMDIVVAGAGTLSRHLCVALARSRGSALRVAVMARSGAAAEELSRMATRDACATASDTQFHAITTDFESADHLGFMLARLQPRIIVCCVSHHSPWESTSAPSRWTELISAAGFGITLPLQFSLVARIARSAGRHAPQAVLVNGCFPDAVNVALRASGLPILCGIGNVASLAEALQAALGPDAGRLQLLAHHRHLNTPTHPADEAIAWLSGEPLRNVSELLRPARSIPRKELCELAGTAAAALLRALLGEREWVGHAPGPDGLPGGYPVRVRDGKVELDLPPRMSIANAIEWNQASARADGVVVSMDGGAVFSAKASEVLQANDVELAPGFRVDQMEQACEAMLSLRARLRERSADLR